MKHVFLSLTLLISTLCAVVNTAQAVQKMDIKEVKIYLQGAELIQTAKVAIAKGTQDITLSGLSPVINNLQVKLDGKAVISSYELGIDFLAKDQLEKHILTLQDSLKQCREQLAIINNDLDAQKQMLILLEKGISHSLTVEQQNISSETIEKNLNYYQRRVAQINAQRYSMTLKRQQLAEREKQLLSQIQQDGTCHAPKTGIITLHLTAPTAENALIEVRYFTDLAYWEPTYDLQIPHLGAPTTFEMKAQVAQTTGIDWKQVPITLSTGMPTLSNTAPTLSTWFLHQYQLEQMRLYVDDAMMLYKPKTLTANVNEKTATRKNFITEKEQPLSHEYTIALPYTILGNGKEQTIDITSKQADQVEYTYIAIPKLDKKAYLTASIGNWETLGLLSANANIMFNGTYYGETFIDAYTTEDKLKLTIGSDPQVSITREQQLDFSKKRTFGTNTETARAYIIKVKNNKSQAIKIHIEEPYPISTEKSIEVKLLDTTTTWTKNDTTRGMLSYDIALQPGESKELTIAFSVKYPKDWNINL